MSTARHIEQKPVNLHIHSLLRKITKLPEDELTSVYKKGLNTLGSAYVIANEGDEFAIAGKIKKKFIYEHRESDAALFSELHCKLQSQQFLKNRWAILHLLLRLSDNESKRTVMSNAFSHGLSGHPMSTPYLSLRTPRDTPRNPANHTTLQMSSNSTGTSGIASSISTIHSENTSRFAQFTPSTNGSSNMLPPMTTGSRLFNTFAPETQEHHGRTKPLSKPHRRKKGDQEDVTEQMLLREVIYAFQGIESRLIHIDLQKDSFQVVVNVNVSPSMRKAVSRLTECGWLYSKVHKYVESHSTDRAFGLVGQSFCAALQKELSEYYSLIAVLESQLHIESDPGISLTDSAGAGLTLHTLSVWTIDPQVRLKALAALVDVCHSKKGGALATAIHSYLQHGDPVIQACVKFILIQVAQPIFTTILRWIYDGELEDTYQEFFVASDPTVKDEQLWLSKYSLRRLMLPSFLTHEQAKKILLTGKSINYLRQICHDRTVIRTRDEVRQVETHKVECIFNQDLDNTFSVMIDTIYKETSKHLMEVLHEKYKFMEHLKAMRRYLLLGQGDFIRHLMDLLEDYLPKPASTLFLHNLSGVLEAAIRATNAQYDDSDILKRVDVRLLEVSPGDTGWDVFSLDYHVDGPIRTVFTPQCMLKYLRVFNFLWRAKRMEYILAGIWKGQMANGRFLKHMQELLPILNQTHVICSEMIHFVQQVQYYINFEVLECTWDELLQQVLEATDLDEILFAHNNFLSTIIARCLLDEQSCDILTQLRTIFDLIIKFQTIQDDMYQAACYEQDARQRYASQIELNTQQSGWGTSERGEAEENARRRTFVTTFIPSIISQLTVLTQSYQNMVQQFLVMLTNHPDVNLRFLSFRLDFNEHYHVKEPRLSNTSIYQKSLAQ